MEGEKGVKVKSAGPGNAWLEGKTLLGLPLCPGNVQAGAGNAGAGWDWGLDPWGAPGKGALG